MLTSKDYRRDNWEHVTWQIVSGVYARGYVESTVIPPDDYLHWMMDDYFGESRPLIPEQTRPVIPG